MRKTKLLKESPMRSRRPARLAPVLLGLLLLGSGAGTRTGVAQTARQPALPSPEQFFGFQMGADRKLANWDKLHEYYQHAREELEQDEAGGAGQDERGPPVHRALHLVARQPREARSLQADSTRAWPIRAGSRTPRRRRSSPKAGRSSSSPSRCTRARSRRRRPRPSSSTTA